MPDFSLPAHGYTALEAVTGIASHASAHTKGAWVTLDASTSFDADGIVIGTHCLNGNYGTMVDVAIGAAAAEQTFLENFLVANCTELNQSIYVPIEIPAGSRIAARCQYGNAGPQSPQVSATLIRGGLLQPPPGGQVITLGAATGSTGGTSIDPGGSANTYGSWVQMSASTDSDIVALWPVVGNKGHTSPQYLGHGSFRLDVGVGAAAAEVAAISGLPFGSYTNALYSPPAQMWYPVSIPAGSRVAARARCGTTDATDRTFDLVLYALVN